MKLKDKYKKIIYHKGYTITFIGNEWRANAYANPQFTNTNLDKLKKQINEYLKS